jgi:hypothetical protein
MPDPITHKFSLTDPPGPHALEIQWFDKILTIEFLVNRVPALRFSAPVQDIRIIFNQSASTMRPSPQWTFSDGKPDGFSMVTGNVGGLEEFLRENGLYFYMIRPHLVRIEEIANG